MHSEKAEKVSYYNTSSIEAIEYIELLHIPFSLGTALKYIIRCNTKNSKKDNKYSEMDKILYYIGRELKNPQYTWHPPGQLFLETTNKLKDIELPVDIAIALFWLVSYIRCNKVIESKDAKDRYLTLAMENIRKYRDNHCAKDSEI